MICQIQLAFKKVKSLLSDDGIYHIEVANLLSFIDTFHMILSVMNILNSTFDITKLYYC